MWIVQTEYVDWDRNYKIKCGMVYYMAGSNTRTWQGWKIMAEANWHVIQQCYIFVLTDGLIFWEKILRLKNLTARD